MKSLVTPPATRILVIDDEASIRDFIHHVFADSNYVIEFATDGFEGLEKAQSLLPDLILLDVMMPELDGFEVCRKLREDPVLAEVPILMITALDDRKSRLEGLEAGADEFVTKPLDVQELRTRVGVIARLNRFRRQLAEQEKFTRVVDLAPDGILILNAELEIVFVNHASERIFQSSAELPLAETPFAMLLLNRAEEIEAGLRDILAGQSDTLSYDARMLRLNGEELAAAFSAGRLTWEEQPALQINLKDVTEQKQLEAGFLRAQRLQGLGSIAGGVAHDLNNLLTPIILASQSLEDGEADPTRRHLIDTISNAGRHGAAVVQQILAFTRGIDESRPVPLKYVIKDTVKVLSEALPAGVELQTDFAPEDPVVNGNPTELNQLLMNLCVNARDAMPDGGTLTLASELCELGPDDLTEQTDAKPGRWVKLRVTDTGVGMDEATLEKVWQPFFTTKPTGSGTGLGLASVTTIIRRHGGFTRATSEPGEGSCFAVYLPASDEVPRPVTADTSDLPGGHGQTVLIIEGDAAVRELEAEILSCHGYQVLTAGDGPEAIGLFSRNARAIDAVICDRDVPLLDGMGVIQALRRIRQDLPCVLAFAPRDEPEPPRAEFPLLPKPFDRRALLTTVAEVLKTNADTERND